MNTLPQRPDRKTLLALLTGAATLAASLTLGLAEGPPGLPMGDTGAASVPTLPAEGDAPAPQAPLPPPTAAPAEDVRSGLNIELLQLKEGAGTALSGYRIVSLEPVGEPVANSSGGYRQELALKVRPSSDGESISIDLNATRDSSGKWTVPSQADLRDALRVKVGGNAAVSGQGVIGSTGTEVQPRDNSIDISAPADMQSVTKTARAQDDITGSKPPPDSLTLPFSKNAAPIVPLDGEMPSSSDLEPVPTTGKPYTPPAVSLDGPIDGGGGGGDSLQPQRSAPNSGDKSRSLDGPTLDSPSSGGAADDTILAPVEGGAGRTSGGPGGGGGPSLPPKVEGTGPSLD
jgi:hypothetical protein